MLRGPEVVGPRSTFCNLHPIQSGSRVNGWAPGIQESGARRPVEGRTSRAGHHRGGAEILTTAGIEFLSFVPTANTLDGPLMDVTKDSSATKRNPSMNRRSFLKSAALTSAAATVGLENAQAALPRAKITKVNIYRPPNLNLHFNQS